MWQNNYFLLLKLLRQIMQVSNLSHDVNSNVLLNFVICLNGLLAVRAAQLQVLGMFLNKFPCAQQPPPVEWYGRMGNDSQIFQTFITFVELFSLTRWLKPSDICLCSGRGCKGHSCVSASCQESWANPKIPQFCWCVA